MMMTMKEKEIAENKIIPYLEKLGWPLELVSQYGRVPVQMGTDVKWADIVLYIVKNNVKIPYLVLEVKSNLNNIEDAKKQAESYSKFLNTNYFGITDGENHFFFLRNNRGDVIPIKDLPMPDNECLLITEKTKPIEYMVKMSKSVCTQCTECTNLCPRYLIGYDLKPHLIMRQINYGLYFPQLIIENAFLCSECGLCEYACAMGLSPRIVIKEIKKELKVQGFSPSFQNVNRPVRDIREYRKVPTSRLINRLHLAKYADYVTNNLIQTNPDRVEIMLKQHIGEPSYAIVQVGDMVKEGSLIAKIPDGAIGSNIHASISGKVLIADKDRIIIER